MRAEPRSVRVERELGEMRDLLDQIRATRAACEALAQEAERGPEVEPPRPTLTLIRGGLDDA